MNYAEYVSAVETILVITPGNAKFASVLPRMIEYAELRMIRDLDFLQTVGTDVVPLVAGNRSVTLPSELVVVNSANVVTPAATLPDDGVRNPLQRVTVDFLNFAWPQASASSADQIPQYYAMLDQWTAIVAPAPGGAFNFEVVGTFRPEPLSESNPTTFISTYLPDLFLAASLVFGAGYQRDFGSQSDDPQLAISWEQTYKSLLGGAAVEEARKKSMSEGWTPYMPVPIATPPRA